MKQLSRIRPVKVVLIVFFLSFLPDSSPAETLSIQPVSNLPLYQSHPYSIIPLPLWTVEAPMQGLFTYLVDVGNTLKIGCYVWYIKGPELNIIVDAGDKASNTPGAIPYLKDAEPDADPITPSLAKIGLTPQDIDVVILTQLHYDHCALARLFTNAKLVVQSRELKAVYDPPTAQRIYYNKKLIENLEFEVVEGDARVTDGVWVISTPGHTPGGQSVVVDTQKGRAIISGLCTIQMNFEPPKPWSDIWPVITPGIHSDAEQSYGSLIKIKGMADFPVSLHDIKWTQVQSIP